MAGAGKHRQKKEKKGNGNGNGKSRGDSKNSPPSTQESAPSPQQKNSPPTGWDGNRDPAASQQAAMDPSRGSGVVASRTLRNLDLGLAGSLLIQGYDLESVVQRPGYNKTGRPTSIVLNTFNCEQLPRKPIYQYDVSIGTGKETRGLLRRLWASKKSKHELGPGWIYDGVKIAYSMQKFPNKDWTVNMDEEMGRTPRNDKNGNPKPDVHRVFIKIAGNGAPVPMASLISFLDGTLTTYTDECLQATTFLDHLLRETPSQSLVQIKRNFFQRGETRKPLGGAVEAFKGVYASIRAVNRGPGASPKAVMSVNVDVANTTFWCPYDLHTAAFQLLNLRDLAHLVNALQPTAEGKPTQSFLLLRRFAKVTIQCFHRDRNNPDEYVIDRFIMDSARNHKMQIMDDGKSRTVTVAQYFEQRYSRRLQYPDLPIVQTTKKSKLPMELCTIKPNQRYGWKLAERQTSEMIKFSATLPAERWQSIQHGLKMLNWGGDQYFANYGLKISNQPAKVQAKLLPNPKVHFGPGSQGNPVDPGQSGRWDLKGKKFLFPAGTKPAERKSPPLKAWGVAIMKGRFGASKDDVAKFMRTFIGQLRAHGIAVEQQNPVVQEATVDAAQTVERLWNGAGNQAQMRPQLLVFIVPDKRVDVYNRIKKSCDCRYGVVSQVLQSAHVQKAQLQYCSNVAMKVNAKLGGYTAQAIGMKNSNMPFSKPTVIVGADVSHGAPGGTGHPSIAAITVSWDKQCIRYAAGVETNGMRTEMITKANWLKVLQPYLENWIKEVGNGNFPQHLIYLRDGVSEGQYSHVLQQEVRDIKEVLRALNPKHATRVTAVVCSKRHHIRFFPDKGQGDRNSNPKPGTLVETGCTHPYEYDFYLCAHSAIKGTARPVHYYVVLDEAKMGVEELQNMLYEASYQYVRSTTPVSLHPAIYYAHLAAARANSHINQPSVSSGPESKSKTDTTARDAEAAPLLKMPDLASIGTTMWYV